MIRVNLDVMMARRRMSLNELARQMDLSLANLSILKNNKCRAIRFSTLSNLCRILNCQVTDLLEYEEGEQNDGTDDGTDDRAGDRTDDRTDG